MGEEIIINGNIVVTVISIAGNRVKLGFNAPPSVIIHRKELADEIAAEEAAQANGGPAHQPVP